MSAPPKRVRPCAATSVTKAKHQNAATAHSSTNLLLATCSFSSLTASRDTSISNPHQHNHHHQQGCCNYYHSIVTVYYCVYALGACPAAAAAGAATGTGVAATASVPVDSAAISAARRSVSFFISSSGSVGKKYSQPAMPPFTSTAVPSRANNALAHVLVQLTVPKADGGGTLGRGMFSAVDGDLGLNALG